MGHPSLSLREGTAAPWVSLALDVGRLASNLGAWIATLLTTAEPTEPLAQSLEALGGYHGQVSVMGMRVAGESCWAGFLGG